VYSATRTRERFGLHGIEGLTKLQKTIYEFIRNNRKVTREAILQDCHLTEPELQTQLATLRHCELVRGLREAGQVYFAPYNSEVTADPERGGAQRRPSLLEL
jgi:hypothetical protein